MQKLSDHLELVGRDEGEEGNACEGEQAPQVGNEVGSECGQGVEGLDTQELVVEDIRQCVERVDHFGCELLLVQRVHNRQFLEEGVESGVGRRAVVLTTDHHEATGCNVPCKLDTNVRQVCPVSARTKVNKK